MNVLVVGSGGREHAICWKLAQSPLARRIFCAPGNGGISEIAECVPISATDFPALIAFAKENAVDFTVASMDEPLVLGIVDAFESVGLKIFGPRADAAILEGSKAFSKALMRKYDIPTAEYESFEDYGSATAYLRDRPMPVVLKADGLAFGKGVLICETREEAENGLKYIMLDRAFGSSGSRVVIEEFMEGREVSILAFTDGKTIVPMVSAQDHKRAYDGDRGSNTGGMGNISPSRHYSEEDAAYCQKRIFEPTIRAMEAEGRPFKGVIFFGLMMTREGAKVVEYNARFGDPEAQVVLPRLESDLLEIMLACVDGRLAETDIKWSDRACCCVMAASGGYPGQYARGFLIEGLDEIKEPGLLVFHSGTEKRDGKFYTNGGRVLGIVGIGGNIDSAIQSVYEEMPKIQWDGIMYRTDIGKART